MKNKNEFELLHSLPYWIIIIVTSTLVITLIWAAGRIQSPEAKNCSVIKAEYDGCIHNQRVFMGTAKEK